MTSPLELIVKLNEARFAILKKLPPEALAEFMVLEFEIKRMERLQELMVIHHGKFGGTRVEPDQLEQAAQIAATCSLNPYRSDDIVGNIRMDIATAIRALKGAVK